MNELVAFLSHAEVRREAIESWHGGPMVSRDSGSICLIGSHS